MGRIAFVFSGQGAQYGGMGRDLYENSPAARAVFDLADQIRPNTSRQCFEGSAEELAQTENTQPCIFAVSMAAAAALKEAGVFPELLAGFSLGEVSALTFSGALSLEEGFRLVCRRAELMAQAAKTQDSAMAAVLKLPFEKVEALCKEFNRVYPVNYNCPGQLVVAGDSNQLEDFKIKVKQAGGRSMPLSVSGGFHSPFMAQAAENMALELEERYSFGELQIPVYANATAAPYSKEEIKRLLAAQIISPVLWQQSVEAMMAAGADIFIEAGPGKTLCNLIGKISDRARAYHVEDTQSLRRAVEAVKDSC